MSGAATGTIVLRVPSALREQAGGAAVLEVEVEPGAEPTVRAVLDDIGARLPGLHRRIRDEEGNLRRHVNVFVGDTNVRDADALDTVVPAGVEVFLAPAVSGG